MQERKIIEVDLNQKDYFELNYMDECKKGLSELILHLQLVLNSVPEKYKDSTMFRFSQSGDEWDSYGEANIEIYYKRPETDEEYNSRIELQNKSEKRRDEQEFMMYQRLKNKFEPDH